MFPLNEPPKPSSVTHEHASGDRLLSVRNLGVSFDGHAVLRDVSFDVGEGESVAIIGPNGSGKSVLLKAMLGLVPHKGVVDWRPGTTIGYVPQKIDADRSLPLTARNLLHAKANVIRCPLSDVDAAIRRVGLTGDVVSRPVGQLSGGEFQRVLIAFAILGNPAIILFDEPTASIDEPGEEKMFDLIARLQSDMHMATITVSHDLTFVYRRANRVLCLNRSGRCYGPPREALTAELLDELFNSPAFYDHASHP